MRLRCLLSELFGMLGIGFGPDAIEEIGSRIESLRLWWGLSRLGGAVRETVEWAALWSVVEHLVVMDVG